MNILKRKSIRSTRLLNRLRDRANYNEELETKRLWNKYFKGKLYNKSKFELAIKEAIRYYKPKHLTERRWK